MNLKRIITALVVVIILMNPFFSTDVIPMLQEDKEGTYTISQDSFDGLTIESNDGFAALSTGGDGSETSPYIIEDLHAASDSFSVVIYYTTAFFIFRNCYFESIGEIEGIVDNLYGSMFTLYGVYNGMFDNCTFKGGRIGITLYASMNTTIRNSMFSRQSLCSVQNEGSINTSISDTTFNHGGIIHRIHSPAETLQLDNCTVNGKLVGYFMKLENQTIDGSTFGQILLDRCKNVTIQGLITVQVSSPVQFIKSENCSIHSCRMQDSIYSSISCFYATAINILDNTMTGAGIQFDYSHDQIQNYTIENNTINGKDVAFYDSKENITISGYGVGQIILSNCTEFTIKDTEFLNGGNSMYISDSSDVHIENILISNCSSYGIFIIDSSAVSIALCILYKVPIGIGASYVNGFQVSDSLFLNHTYGIVTSIISNFVISNNEFGSEQNGLYVLSSNNGTIMGNSVSSRMGMLIEANDINLMRNSFNSCGDLALFIQGSNNHIAGNAISNSGIGMQVGGRRLTIENNSVDNVTHAMVCVGVLDSVITNCSFSDSQKHLTISNAQRISVIDCIFYGSGQDSISILNSANVDITGCLIDAGQMSGIRVTDSNAISVVYSEVINCQTGIRLERTSVCTITLSTIDHCLNNGIHLANSESVQVINSSIAYNGNNGIYLTHVSQSTFNYNMICKNSAYGIEVNIESIQNSFGKNTFCNNSAGNALDNGADNIWDSNYWDDWYSPNVYDIPGAAGSVDNRPKQIPLERIDWTPTILAAALILSVILLAVLCSKKNQLRNRT